MKIVFLMLSYPNVDRRNTSLYTDLVLEFKKHGHDVLVVAPSSFNEPSTVICKEGGVNVLRVKTLQLLNVNPIKKGIANLLLPYQFKRALQKHIKDCRFDVVISPTPPITFYKTVKWLKRGNAQFYLILRDIFPQNAKDIGLIKHAVLFKYFKRLEKNIYRLASKIGCMSPANIDFVVRHNPGISKEKLHLLPNWENVIPHTGVQPGIKEKYGLANKFVAVFGGNIGIPQRLETVLELAERKKSLNDVVFLIIGDGTERERIEKLAEQMRLSNVVFKNTIPREDYQALIKACDIGLICLDGRFTIPNIPSKTLSYFNAKIPVLASVDKNTDYGQILDDAQAGLWSITGDVGEYAENFDKLYQNEQLRKQMGENGYAYMAVHYTTAIAYQTIIKEIS